MAKQYAKTISQIICFIQTIPYLILGSSLFFFPEHFLKWFNSKNVNENSIKYHDTIFLQRNENKNIYNDKDGGKISEPSSALSMMMVRFCGNVLFTFGITIIMYVFIKKCVRDKKNEGDVGRALTSHGIFGLLMLLQGLLGFYNNNSFGIDFNISLLCIGSVYIILTSVGQMAWFWADSNDGNNGYHNANLENDSNYHQIREDRMEISYNQHGQVLNDSMLVPLLEHNALEDTSNQSTDNLQCEEGRDNNNPSYHSNSSSSHDSEEDLTSTSIITSQNHQEEEEEQQPSSRIHGTRRLLQLAGPNSFHLFTGCVVLLLRLPFSLSIPHFVSGTLSDLAKAKYHSVKINILLLFVMGTIDAALDFWCVFLFGMANLNIVKDVRLNTFQAIIRQDMGFFDNTTSGELASRLNSDCGNMGSDLTWFFRFSIEAVVRISGIVAYMMIRSPRLGACAISVVPIVALVNKKYGDWLHKNAVAVQDALADANSVAQETLSCIRTVIAFASESFELHKYRERIDKHFKLNVYQLYAQGFYYMFVSTFLINTCVQALILFIGLIMIQNGRLHAEVLLAFMLYQGQLQNEVLNLFNSYTSLIKSSGAGDKVFALMDRKTPIPGTGSEYVDFNEDADLGLINTKVNVIIRDLYFAYPSRPENMVIRGLNLDIPAGSTMAIVGSSGCGKSTIIALLQRFYDPLSGAIFINDVDLRGSNIKLHRRRIGVVTQDPILFSGTIMSNIAYGSTTMSEDDVRKAAEMANAHGFIEKFKDKYKTQVGENGVQLSGGQKQRIAIARAILNRPTLLLLDEATSALDNESEKLVQSALDNLLTKNEGVTTIIIAHRLQTVRNADFITVLKDGIVGEVGSHNDLMAKQEGLYRKMIEKASENGTLSVENTNQS